MSLEAAVHSLDTLKSESMKSITWNGESLILLDQTKLPNQETYIDCTDWRQVAEAINLECAELRLSV